MAKTPKWKIYRDGEYVAALKYPEDAAALVGILGGEIRHDHGPALWTEGVEEFPASESYDRVAALMLLRMDAIREAHKNK